VTWINALAERWKRSSRDAAIAGKKLPYKAQSLKSLYNNESHVYEKVANELLQAAEEQGLAVVLDLEAVLEKNKIPGKVRFSDGQVVDHVYASVSWQELDAIVAKYRPKEEVRVET